MKNLDLNNCGVQEMNAGEMRENNGGSFLAAVAVSFLVYVAWDIAMNPSDAAAHIRKGAQSVK